MPQRCWSCRNRFSVETGTLTQDVQLGYRVWTIAIFAFNTEIKGASSIDRHRDLGVTQQSACQLAHRIRELWNQ